MDFFMIWVFPAILVGGLGLVLLLGTQKALKRCKEISSWTKTAGKVDSAEVVSHTSRRRNQVSGISYRTVRYEPRIDYSYEVAGQPFHSTQFQNFNGKYAARDKPEAERIVSEYPAGKPVEITYNPSNPAEAYLKPDPNTDILTRNRRVHLFVILFALIWLGAGAILNLSSLASANSAAKKIQTSNGLLPVTAAQLQPGLDALAQEYHLTCNEEGMAGIQIIYDLKTCSNESTDGLKKVEIYSRKEDPSKVDLISAIAAENQPEEARVFFQRIAGLVLSGDDAVKSNEWILASLNSASGEIEHQEFMVSNFQIALDDLGQNLRINIGNLQ